MSDNEPKRGPGRPKKLEGAYRAAAAVPADDRLSQLKDALRSGLVLFPRENQEHLRKTFPDFEGAIACHADAGEPISKLKGGDDYAVKVGAHRFLVPGRVGELLRAGDVVRVEDGKLHLVS